MVGVLGRRGILKALPSPSYIIIVPELAARGEVKAYVPDYGWVEVEPTR
jgi:hypothetical protein